MTKSGINKMEAAQRQLDCAIRLLEMEEDSRAIHTLAYAAFRVLSAKPLCDAVRARYHHRDNGVG